ncbi:MAG: hypothetical protein D4R67_01430 [Bacteroidetes bacterium]|nr:MAG: hypothetical protein D4R67_01430 [Bacteroidota bacterium]
MEEIIRENSIFSSDYKFKFGYLFDTCKTPVELYRFIVKLVFNSDVSGQIELYTLRNSQGEIALKVHNSDFYFGLINIGDVGAFKTSMKEEFRFETDVLNNSLFDALPARTEKPVNILIGARKFIEGWNSYRVSAMGLINFGRAEGSQIIQLFGRGVRLKGREWSLKRTTDDGPANIRVMETLNIFGLNADYMRRFKDDLEKEGINVQKERISVPTKLFTEGNMTIEELNLITLEATSEISPFHDAALFELVPDDEIDIELNYSTKRLISSSSGIQTGALPTVEIQSLEKYLPVINLNRIYLGLLEYKMLKQYYNLIIPREKLAGIIKNCRYSIILDKEFHISSCNDIDKVEKLTFNLIKKYIDSFYQRHHRIYTSKLLQSKKLEKTDRLLEDTGYELEIVTTDETGNALQDIEQILNEFKQIIDSDQYPENLKYHSDGIKILNNAWFDYHLYQPLLSDKALQAPGYHVDAIVPKGLNTGEFTFVRDLQIHISAEKGKGNYQELKSFCNSLNIFEIGQNSGNIGESGYIALIIEKIVTG